MDKKELEKQLTDTVDKLQNAFLFALADIEDKKDNNIAINHNEVKEMIKSLQAETIRGIEAMLKAKYAYDEACMKDFKENNKVGEVTINKAYFSNYIGHGSGKTSAGQKVEYTVQIGVVTNSPIIGYKDKHFVLTWNDIVNLAENAGLFDEETDK